MTQQLIPLTTTDDGVQAVMGRDLHAFLEIKERYPQWIARHVDKYGFVAGQDFIRNFGKSTGGRPSENHTLTLDMAKELSMVQANERGQQARQYFIECEKRAQQAPAIPQTYSEALRAAADAADRAAVLEAKAVEDAPKVEYHDTFISPDTDVLTIENWGAYFDLTRPQTFEHLNGLKIIRRIVVGREFSKRENRVVDRLEYRAYAPHRHIFELRPQHNAPRYHNGQVRQTLYVRASQSAELARRAGLLQDELPILADETIDHS